MRRVINEASGNQRYEEISMDKTCAGCEAALICLAHSVEAQAPCDECKRVLLFNMAHLMSPMAHLMSPTTGLGAWQEIGAFSVTLPPDCSLKKLHSTVSIFCSECLWKISKEPIGGPRPEDIEESREHGD